MNRNRNSNNFFSLRYLHLTFESTVLDASLVKTHQTLLKALISLEANYRESVNN